MDLLEQGADRTRRSRLPLVLGAAALVGAAVVGLRHDGPGVQLSVRAVSTTAVRPASRDGVVQLELSSGGADAVVDDVQLAREGVSAAPVTVSRGVGRGASARVSVPFGVRSCAELGRTASLRVRAHAPGAASREQVLPVPAAVLDAGCPPGVAAEALAFTARTVGSSRIVLGDGAEGSVLVRVTSLGGGVDRLGVHAEAPGVLFSAATVDPLPAGGSAVLRLTFWVPSCEAVRPTARLVLAVASSAVGEREVVFPVDGDDVDLGAALGACRDGRPQPG